MKDCRSVNKDEAAARIVTRDTAIYALAAMKQLMALGEYSSHRMFADDYSYVVDAMRELEEASKE